MTTHQDVAAHCEQSIQIINFIMKILIIWNESYLLLTLSDYHIEWWVSAACCVILTGKHHCQTLELQQGVRPP